MTITQTVTPSPTQTTSLATEEIESLDALYETLQDEGVSCDSYEEIIDDMSSSCDDGQVLLYFNGGSKKETKLFQASIYLAWGVIRDQEREDEIAILVGPNWFVRISLADANALHDSEIGGAVLH